MANTNYRISIPTIAEFFIVLDLDWDDLDYDFCNPNSPNFDSSLSVEDLQTKIDNVDLLIGKADDLIQWFGDNADTVLELLIEYKGNSKSTLDELLDCNWGDEFGDCYQYGVADSWNAFLSDYISEGMSGETLKKLQEEQDRYIDYDAIAIDWQCSGWSNEGTLFYCGL